MEIKVELSSASETHLRRFVKFLGTKWADTNVDSAISLKEGELLGDSSEVMTALIAKYVEWLKAGEPA
jgi:hypothetical protein